MGNYESSHVTCKIMQRLPPLQVFVFEIQEFVRIGEKNPKNVRFPIKGRLVTHRQIWKIVLCQLRLSIANIASLAYLLKVGGLANLVV